MNGTAQATPPADDAFAPLQPRAMLHAGIPFDFGAGHNYIVPPLALGDVELLQDRLAALDSQSITSVGSIGTVIDAAHRALARNYVCTRAQVAGLVDLGNITEVLEMVMDAAGIKRRAQLAAAAAAQGNAGAPAPQGTAGAASTPA